MGKKKSNLNTVLRRRGNWIGHIMRRNWLLHDDIMIGMMMTSEGFWVLEEEESKSFISSFRRFKRKYWLLKEEVRDRGRWRAKFAYQVQGPANRKNTK